MKKSEPIKDYRRDYVKIYKDMTVTYGEFFEALQQIGFKDFSTPEYFRFKKETTASQIKMAVRPLDKAIWKPSFLGYSHSLYLAGYIQDPDDLAKMIEINREKSQENIESLIASA
jgi:hypothetical protein